MTEHRGQTTTPALPDAHRPALPPPRVTADIYETPGGEAFIMEIPVPGLSADEIVIEATTDTMTVKTEPKQAEQDSERRYIQQEQAVKPMSRLFELPVDIDTDNIGVTLKNGVLRLHVPKAAAAKPKVIRVKKSA